MTSETKKRVLVVGAGGIARRHLKALTETGRATLAIVEPRAEQRQAMAEQWGVTAAYADLAEADLQAYDAAVICAPAHVHVPLAMTCVDAGLPFLLEKPLAVTWQGVQELADAVAAADLPARVGYVRRSDPVLQACHAAVQSGELGDVRTVHVNLSQDFPFYRPDYRTTYYSRPEMGGGAILDALSHCIDGLLWVMGPITEISSIYDHLVLEGVTVEDIVSLQLRFASGAIGQVLVCQFQKPPVDSVEFIGTLGNLRTDREGSTWTNHSQTTPWTRQDHSGGLDAAAQNDRRFRNQANEFLDLLDGAPCSMATIPDALANLKIALAAKASYREKRIITLADWQPEAGA